MEYLIIYQGQPIGPMTNPRADTSMGVVFGQFTPFSAYERVRPVFQRFAWVTRSAIEADDEQVKRAYRDRDALCLSLITRGGFFVPTASIHVYNRGDEVDGQDAYEAEFTVLQSSVFAASGSFFEDQRYWTEDAAEGRD
jgi:hypothetical protein